MAPDSLSTELATPTKPHRPFRRAVFRGLAILMPPLLTVALFIWAWSVVETSVLQPLENVAGNIIAESSKKVLPEIPEGAREVLEAGRVTSFQYDHRNYTQAANGQWVGYYTEEYIKQHHLRRERVLPFFFSVFLLIAYLLGKFVAAGVGRLLVNGVEGLINRVPLVSNVYSSVKQVTDFVLSERDIEFNRVVAVEYPRKGIWSIGFVTGESLIDIRAAANQPVLSVLIPTSPLPMTGYTITILKSEAIDLNMTVDQAVQYMVSCGVVVPRQQQATLDTSLVNARISSAIAQHVEKNGSSGSNGSSKSVEAKKDPLESAGS